MLIIGAMMLLFAATPKAAAPSHPVPDIPTPLFIEDRRLAPKPPYEFEVSFRPAAGHYLDDVHRFYADWAKSKKWRQVSGAEESWSRDEWFSYHEHGGREVWQRMATWVDPSGYWALRLAMRDYRSAPDNRAFVFLTPFVNIDKVQQ